MDKNYYKKIVADLKSSKANKSVKLDFLQFKTLEYWARFLSNNVSYPSPSEMLEILPFPSVSRILEAASKVLEMQNLDEMLNHPNGTSSGPQKNAATNKSKDDDFFLQIFSDDEKKIAPRPRFNSSRKKDCLHSPAYIDRETAIREFAEAIQSCNMELAVDKVRTHFDREQIYDKRVTQVFQKAFINEAIALIANGSVDGDPYFKRLKNVQNVYKLNDLEMEFLIFTWAFYRSNSCNNITLFLTSGRCRSDAGTVKIFQEIFATPTSELEAILDENAPLRRMLILNQDLLLLKSISQYLDGCAGKNFCENYYEVYKGNPVPFEQLQGKNVDAALLLDMVKHHKKGPLNIFFYGVEGSGKTELSKAIASKLGKKLVMTNTMIAGGEHKDNAISNTIHEKMCSIVLANYMNHKENAILLVDEADDVLNGCEKGTLNCFLESLAMPVIWISNNTELIEDSTLRRFDFSMKFERLSARQRKDVWDSIIKTQKATNLLDDETVEKLSAQIPVTAGGITQAIRTAKALKKAGSKIRAKAIVEQMTKAQATLLGLNFENNDKETSSHAPKYSLDVLNTDADMKNVSKILHGYDAKWNAFKESDRADALCVLLYGAPGTGKTEFARHIARELKRPLIIKKASDILDMYVGESEKKIRQMFKDAESQKAILFLDEADSLIRDRRGASRSWEVSQVNEILTNMESFKGIFIAATNFNDCLDQASRRRFALKVKFGYLKPEAVSKVWELFFPKVACPPEAARIPMLAPGDFNAVHGQLRFYDDSEINAQVIMAELKKEVALKDDQSSRRMGF